MIFDGGGGVCRLSQLDAWTGNLGDIMQITGKSMPLMVLMHAAFTSAEAEGGMTRTLKIHQIEPEFLSGMFTVEGGA